MQNGKFSIGRVDMVASQGTFQENLLGVVEMVMFENGFRKKSTTQPLRIKVLEHVTQSVIQKTEEEKEVKNRRGRENEKGVKC